MELPRGITGFRRVDDAPMPLCDFAGFREHCHAAARALKGRVVSVEAPVRRVDANFAQAVVELPTGPVVVLLNAHFPIVAFAEPLAAGEVHVRFIDAQALAEAFRGFGAYQLPGASELSAPLKPEDYRRLTPAERQQVEYWKPQRIGDVVFNFWD